MECSLTKRGGGNNLSSSAKHESRAFWAILLAKSMNDAMHVTIFSLVVLLIRHQLAHALLVVHLSLSFSCFGYACNQQTRKLSPPSNSQLDHQQHLGHPPSSTLHTHTFTHGHPASSAYIPNSPSERTFTLLQDTPPLGLGCSGTAPLDPISSSYHQINHTKILLHLNTTRIINSSNHYYH